MQRFQWTSNEKAWVGNISAILLTLVAQYHIGNKLTKQEILISVVSGFLTHLAVWQTTNTKGA